MHRIAWTVLVTLLLAALPAPATSAGPRNALERKVEAELDQFIRWLEDHGHARRGYVAEVGWPDGDPRWNDLARLWYRGADRAWLWTSTWSAGEWWPRDYPLTAYEPSSHGDPVDRANAHADVIEDQPPRKRSVTVSGAEFGTPRARQEQSTFSNRNPGEPGKDYAYPTADTFRYLASRNLTTVRLPFRWERIQPSLGGPLDPAELDRLRGAVSDAGSAGLDVILDVHNYGAYWLAGGDGSGYRRPLTGDGPVRIGDFVDLWRRLSSHFRGSGAVVAYALMNEPVDLPGGAAAWEDASRAAVRAIRSAGDDTRVMVGSYPWSSGWSFPANHPNGPWIDDGNLFYEAHDYFDCDNSGHYVSTDYDDAVACAERQGY